MSTDPSPADVRPGPPGWVFGVVVALVGFGLLAGRLGEEDAGPGETVLLAINDVYRIEGVDGGMRGGVARVRALRRELERQNPDVLVFLAGDFLFPSLLSEVYGGGQMVGALNRLDGYPGRFDPRLFVTFGNHEFDRGGPAGLANLEAQIFASEFTWLGTNVRLASGQARRLLEEKGVLVPVRLVRSGGLDIGVFSLTTSLKSQDYLEPFNDLRTTAQMASRMLRDRGADVVVALTHLSIDEDRKVLRELDAEGPDLILGGHEHQRHAEAVEGRWIVKADSDARTASIVRIRLRDGGRPSIAVDFRFLDDGEVKPDPSLARWVRHKLTEHDRKLCREMGLPPKCLDTAIATAAVPLVAEEQEIRRFETNFGNWVADQMRTAMDADVAFVNAGALRLNQDIPAGPVALRHLLELVAYPESEVVSLEVSGEVLQRVVDRSIEEWTGEGHFLQVSGLAFRHAPGATGAMDLSLVERDGDASRVRSVQPDDTIRVATLAFLRDGNDGYDCMALAARTEGGEGEGGAVAEPPPVKAKEPWQRSAALVAGCVQAAEGAEPAAGDGKVLLLELLCQRLRASDGPFEPKVEGRICNPLREGPCLVQSSASQRLGSCQESGDPAQASAGGFRTTAGF